MSFETFQSFDGHVTWTLQTGPDAPYAFAASVANPPVVNYVSCISCGTHDLGGGLWRSAHRLVCVDCADPDAILIPTDQQADAAAYWDEQGIGGN